MAFTSGFAPIHEGFIRFSTEQFSQGNVVGAASIRDKIVHNLEWLYGTSTQIRVNWNNKNPLKVFAATKALSTTAGSFLYSEGPFILNQLDDGTPMPLYVRVEAGPALDGASASTYSADVSVHLRQGNQIGQSFSGKEIGTFSVLGIPDSRETFELTTVNSSLSVSSSILEIDASDVHGFTPLSIRTGIDSEKAKDRVVPMMCWLDFYAMGTNVGGKVAEGISFYGVFAQEFCPRINI